MTSLVSARGRIAAFVLLVIGGMVALTGCQSEARTGTPPAAQSNKSTVDIIALDHPPVQPVIAEIDALLDPYRDRATVRRLAADEEEGKTLAESKGITGHMPVVVLINGNAEVAIGDRRVKFTGFPQGKAPIKAAEGQWTMDDLRAALEQELKAT